MLFGGIGVGDYSDMMINNLLLLKANFLFLNKNKYSPSPLRPSPYFSIFIYVADFLRWYCCLEELELVIIVIG